MARNMPGKKVGRPAQGDNKGMREDAKWAPKPQPAAKIVGTGTVSNPKSAGAQATFRPDHIKVTKTINNPGPPA